ncbi:hypothetical protein [Cerasicoccus fimbriatus]|uniref:hypothetical protein n=1 Tax=Cerasicoccus fimbriatus TaxID=3014554 RepID=UPI0022B344BF|nr:hypothetical protein [Cerasicoccus sp. TK19100]
MNYPRFNELYYLFGEFLEDLHALYLDSIVGYELLHERLEKHQDFRKEILGDHPLAKRESLDKLHISYKALGGTDYQAMSLKPLMTQGAFRSRIQPNGKNYQTLGSMIIVSSYAYWEEFLRIEIGKAMGVLDADAENSKETRKILNKEVRSDFWGDMRHLRTSIVHSLGLANSDMAKCKLIKWFKPGDRITFNNDQLREIFLLLGEFRNEIHAMQFPPRSFTIDFKLKEPQGDQ